MMGGVSEHWEKSRKVKLSCISVDASDFYEFSVAKESTD